MLFATAAINLYVDPAKLFDWNHRYEIEMTKILTNGKYVVGMSNYDERILQKMRTQLASPNVSDWIVMGSSRSMQISSEMLRRNILNLSVSGASVEDYVAVNHMISKWQIKNFIIGVDPWIFNANSDQDRWLSVCDDYRNGLELIGLRNLGSTIRCSLNIRWLQLINFEYTKTSVLGLVARIRKGRFEFSESLENLPDPLRDTIRPDGSRMYSLKYANRTSEETAAYIQSRAEASLYALNKYSEIDERYWSIFWSLLTALNADGNANIIIFLPAYHPIAYERINYQVSIVGDLEQRIRSKAVLLGIEVRGSYDSSIAGCEQDEFYDEIHPRESCIERQLKPFIALNNK